VVYLNKLYITSGEYFDLATKKWGTWPAPAGGIARFPCFLKWRDTFIAMDYYRVQMFNLTTQTWSVVGAPLQVSDHFYCAFSVLKL
jgi:hypothetical protein